MGTDGVCRPLTQIRTYTVDQRMPVPTHPSSCLPSAPSVPLRSASVALSVRCLLVDDGGGQGAVERLPRMLLCSGESICCHTLPRK